MFNWFAKWFKKKHTEPDIVYFTPEFKKSINRCNHEGTVTYFKTPNELHSVCTRCMLQNPMKIVGD